MKTIKRISAIVVLLALIMTFCASALASTAYVTTGSCNMRKYPDLDAKVLKTVPKGVKLVAKSSDKDDRGVKWIKCTYNGKTGWVSTVNLKKQSDPKGYSYVKATGGNTYIRKGPDRDSKILGDLPKGAAAKYLNVKKKDADGRKYVWYKVSYKGVTGYVSSRYTELVK